MSESERNRIKKDVGLSGEERAHERHHPVLHEEDIALGSFASHEGLLVLFHSLGVVSAIVDSLCSLV